MQLERGVLLVFLVGSNEEEEEEASEMLIVINNNNLRPWLYGTLITGGKWENGFGLITIFIGWRYLLKYGVEKEHC